MSARLDATCADAIGDIESLSISADFAGQPPHSEHAAEIQTMKRFKKSTFSPSCQNRDVWFEDGLLTLAFALNGTSVDSIDVPSDQGSSMQSREHWQTGRREEEVGAPNKDDDDDDNDAAMPDAARLMPSSMQRTLVMSESDSEDQVDRATLVPRFDVLSGDEDEYSDYDMGSEEEEDEDERSDEDPNEEFLRACSPPTNIFSTIGVNSVESMRTFGDASVLGFDREKEQARYADKKSGAAPSVEEDELVSLTTDDEPLEVQYALAIYYAAEIKKPATGSSLGINLDFKKLSFSCYQRVINSTAVIASASEIEQMLKWDWYPSSFRRMCHALNPLSLKNGLDEQVSYVLPLPNWDSIMQRFKAVHYDSAAIIDDASLNFSQKVLRLREYVSNSNFQKLSPLLPERMQRQKKIENAMWADLINNYNRQYGQFSLEYFTPLLVDRLVIQPDYQPSLEQMVSMFRADAAEAIKKERANIPLAKHEVWLMQFNEQTTTGITMNARKPMNLWKYFPSWSLIYEDFTFFLQVMFPRFWDSASADIPKSNLSKQLDWLNKFAIEEPYNTFNLHIQVNLEQSTMNANDQKVIAAYSWVSLMREYKQNGEVKRSTFLRLAQSTMLCGRRNSAAEKDDAVGVFGDAAGIRPMWREFYAIDVPVWAASLSRQPSFAFRIYSAVQRNLTGFHNSVTDQIVSPQNLYALNATLVNTASTYVCMRQNVEWMWAELIYKWKKLYDDGKRSSVPPWIRRFKVVNFDDDEDVKRVPNTALAFSQREIIVSTTLSVGNNIVKATRGNAEVDEFKLIFPPDFWNTQANMGYELFLFSLGLYATLPRRTQIDELELLDASGTRILVERICKSMPRRNDLRINSDYKFRNPIGLSTTSSFDSIHGQRTNENYKRFYPENDGNALEIQYASVDKIKKQLSFLKLMNIGSPGDPIPAAVYDVRSIVQVGETGSSSKTTRPGLEGDTFYGIDIAPDLASYSIVEYNAIEQTRAKVQRLDEERNKMNGLQRQMNSISNAFDRNERLNDLKNRLVVLYNQFSRKLSTELKDAIVGLQSMLDAELRTAIKKMMSRNESSLGVFQSNFALILRESTSLKNKRETWDGRSKNAEHGLVYKSMKRTNHSDSVLHFANGNEYTQNQILKRLCTIDIRRTPNWNEITALNNAYREELNSKTKGIRVAMYILMKIDTLLPGSTEENVVRLRANALMSSDFLCIVCTNKRGNSYSVEDAQQKLSGIKLAFDQDEFDKFKPNGCIPRSGVVNDADTDSQLVYPYVETLNTLPPQHHIEDGGHVKLKSKSIEDVAKELYQEAEALLNYISNENNVAINMQTACVMLESVENCVEALFVRAVQPGLANTSESLLNYDMLWEQVHAKTPNNASRTRKRKTKILQGSKQSWTAKEASRFVRIGRTQLASRTNVCSALGKQAEPTCTAAINYEDSLLWEMQQLGLVFRYGGYRLKERDWREHMLTRSEASSRNNLPALQLSSWRPWFTQSSDDMNEYTIGKPRAPHDHEERQFYTGILNSHRPDLRSWGERMQGDTFQPPRWNVQQFLGQFEVNVQTDITLGSNSRGLFYDSDSVVKEFCNLAMEYAELYSPDAQMNDFFSDENVLPSANIAEVVASNDGFGTAGIMFQMLALFERSPNRRTVASPALQSIHFNETPHVFGILVQDESADVSSEQHLMLVLEDEDGQFVQYNGPCNQTPSHSLLKRMHNTLERVLDMHQLQGAAPAWASGKLPSIQTAAFWAESGAKLKKNIDLFAKEFTEAHIEMAVSGSTRTNVLDDLERRMQSVDGVYNTHVQLVRLGVVRQLLLDNKNVKGFASSFVACKMVEQYHACRAGDTFNIKSAYRRAANEFFDLVSGGSFATLYSENYTKFVFYDMCLKYVNSELDAVFRKLTEKLVGLSMPAQRFYKFLEAMLMLKKSTFEEAYSAKRMDDALFTKLPVPPEDKLEARQLVKRAYFVFSLKGVSTRTRKQYVKYKAANASREFSGWIGVRDQAHASIPKRDFPRVYHCELLDQPGASKRKSTATVSTEEAMAAKAQRSDVVDSAGKRAESATNVGSTLSPEREQSILELAQDIKLMLAGYEQREEGDEALNRKLKRKYPGILNQTSQRFVGLASLQKFAEDVFALFSDVYQESSPRVSSQPLIYDRRSYEDAASANGLAFFKWPSASNGGTFTINLRKLYMDDYFRNKYYHRLRNLTFSAMARLDREFDRFEAGDELVIMELKPVSLVESLNSKQWSAHARICEFAVQLANRFVYGTLTPSDAVNSIDDFVATNPSRFNANGSEWMASIMLTELKLDMQDVQDWELRWNQAASHLEVLRHEDIYLCSRDIFYGDEIGDTSRNFMDSSPCPYTHPFLFDAFGMQTTQLNMGRDIRNASNNVQWWAEKKRTYQTFVENVSDQTKRKLFQKHMPGEKDVRGIQLTRIRVPSAAQVVKAIQFIVNYGRNPEFEASRPVIRVTDSDTCKNYAAFFAELKILNGKSNMDRFKRLFQDRNLLSSQTASLSSSSSLAQTQDSSAKRNPFLKDAVFRPMASYLPGGRPFEKYDDAAEQSASVKAAWFLNEAIRNYSSLRVTPPSQTTVVLPTKQMADGLQTLMRNEASSSSSAIYLSNLRDRITQAASLASTASPNTLEPRKESVEDELEYLVLQASRLNVHLYPRMQYEKTPEESFETSAFQDKFEDWFSDAAKNVESLDPRLMFSEKIVPRMRLILDGEVDDMTSDVQFRK